MDEQDGEHEAAEPQDAAEEHVAPEEDIWGPPPQAGRRLASCVAPIVVGAVILVLLILGAVTESPLQVQLRDRRLRMRCRNNLNQLAKGMATYLYDYADGRFYPWPSGREGCGGDGEEADFSGAEWLATLYWTHIVSRPSVFICPSSPDTNRNGSDLGDGGCSGSSFRAGPDGKLRPEAVSYAGYGADSVSTWQREKLKQKPSARCVALRADAPSDEPMASGDTEGTINHGTAHNGEMGILFLDSHVEFWTHTKVDLEHGVGKGELVALRN